jgi:hypothetical protein
MTGPSRTAALVKEFADLAVVQATATRAAKANRAADRLAAIYRELRDLGSASLSAFMELTGHPHDAVRLWAAAYGLQFAPETAEPVLEALSKGPFGPIRATASITLNEWRNGRLKFP